MLSKYSTLVILGLGSISQAVFVPRGTPNGVYSLAVAESGTQDLIKIADLVPMPANSTTRVDEVSSATNLPRARIQKRVDAYGCQPITLNQNDIGQAAYNLGRTCG